MFRGISKFNGTRDFINTLTYLYRYPNDIPMYKHRNNTKILLINIVEEALNLTKKAKKKPIENFKQKFMEIEKFQNPLYIRLFPECATLMNVRFLTFLLKFLCKKF